MMESHSKMMLRITQVRSAIGTKPKHKGTLRALGLGKIGKHHILPDRPEIRGMINRVPHLIQVEEIVAVEEVMAGEDAEDEAPENTLENDAEEFTEETNEEVLSKISES